MAIRSYDPDTDFLYMCTVALTSGDMTLIWSLGTTFFEDGINIAQQLHCGYHKA